MLWLPVFNGVKTPGWGGEGDAVMVDGMTPDQLMTTSFTYDAFATGYVVVDGDGVPEPVLPRLLITAPAALRRAGGDVFMAVTFVDLDNPKHAPWKTPAEAKNAVDILADLLPEAAVYATKAGARVVLKLRRLTALEEFPVIAACAARYVQDAMRKGGLTMEVDKSFREWTRQFRLPFVTRDGKFTGDSAFLRLPEVWVGWYPGQSLVGDAEQEIERLSADYTVNTARPRTQKVPSQTILLAAQSAGMSGPPHLRPAIQRIVLGERFYDVGDRNARTFAVLGSFARFLAARRELPTPEDLLYLLWNSIAASTGTSPEEALDETWGMCTRTSARLQALVEVAERDLKSMIEAIKERVVPVVYTNKARYIWDPLRRTYGPPITNDQTLMAELGRTHPAILFTDDGKLRPVHAVLREHGQMAHAIHNILGKSTSRLVDDLKGRKILEMGIAAIVPVPAIFHADCAEFLEVFAGAAPAEEGRRFLHWLATCTQLESPTTALWLRGEPRAGKGLIAGAVGQLFGGKADFFRAMQRFNADMLTTAFIHLDEGVDENVNPSERAGISGRFRETLGGRSLTIEQKGIDPVTVEGNYRVMITTNNPYALPVSNTKSLKDFEAVAERVLHVETGKAPRDWLTAYGGMEATSDWVVRDMGDRREPGRLVEHIAWMAENIDVPSYRDRFLVPANVGSWHVKALLQGMLRDILAAAGMGALSEGYSRIVRAYDGKIYVALDAALGNLVNKVNGTSHDAHDVLTATRDALVDGKPIRLSVDGGDHTKVFYPLPHKLILTILEPSDPDIFVEDAEKHAQLKKILEAA